MPDFESLYQRAACGQLATDTDDFITSVNDTFLELTGHDREALLGKAFHSFLTTGSQLFYETRFQPVLRLHREIREVSVSLVCADGSVLPILINAIVVANEAGEPAEVRAAIFDSTIRQDYEREMLGARRAAELSESKLRVLQQSSTRFLAAETEETIAEALVEAAREAFAVADAAVVLFEPDGMRVAAGDHLQKTLDVLGTVQPSGGGLHPTQVVTISNLEEAEARSISGARALQEARFEGLSLVPLSDGHNILGALVCFYGRPREFDSAALELHQTLAQQSALGLVRVRLQLELARLAMHDQLTGLANRNLLRERLSHAIAAAERSRRPMALLFLDLDGFKQINDQLGHRVGDAVLQLVASRIDSVVREADVVGRFGGDEFLIICEDADGDTAELVAERIKEVVREPMAELSNDFSLTTSVGVAVYLPDEATAPTNDSIVRAADAAMYRSKNSGADRTTIERL